MPDISWVDGQLRPHFDALIARELAGFEFLDDPSDLMMHFIDIGGDQWIHLTGGATEGSIIADITVDGPMKATGVHRLAA